MREIRATEESGLLIWSFFLAWESGFNEGGWGREFNHVETKLQPSPSQKNNIFHGGWRGRQKGLSNNVK